MRVERKGKSARYWFRMIISRGGETISKIKISLEKQANFGFPKPFFLWRLCHLCTKGNTAYSHKSNCKKTRHYTNVWKNDGTWPRVCSLEGTREGQKRLASLVLIPEYIDLGRALDCICGGTEHMQPKLAGIYTRVLIVNGPLFLFFNKNSLPNNYNICKTRCIKIEPKIRKLLKFLLRWYLPPRCR